jgi:transposase-like protein
MATDPTLPNDDNEEYPDPIPETPRGEVGPSEAFWGPESVYELTDLQTRAIELTVQGCSDTQISQILSINRKTLWKWKNLHEEYKRALNAARAEAHANVVDRYRNLLSRAAGILAKVLEDPIEDKRCRGAFALLNMAGSFRPLPIQSDSRPVDYFPPPELPPKVG